jgi:hypothetical protein
MTVAARLALALVLLGAVGCKGKNDPNEATGSPNGDKSGPRTSPNDPNKVVLGGSTGGGFENPKGSGDPSAAPNGGAGGAAAQPSREVSKKSYKKFNGAVEDYLEAKKDGKLADKCDKIAKNFEESYDEDKNLIEGSSTPGRS